MVTGGVRGCRMVQASPQVTAAQVLDAGRRAEADGRVEYAIQFYRHLTDHHSGAPEADVAREALTRLKRQRSHSEPLARARPANPPPLRSTGAGQRGLAEVPRAGPKVGRGPIRIAPVGTAQSPVPLELPEPPAEYFTGRLLAYAFAGVGVLVFLTGVLMAVALVLTPAEMAARMPAWIPALHPLAGAAAALIGLVLAFSGQVARAVFDLASASRDIAAIERAKAEHANAAIR